MKPVLFEECNTVFTAEGCLDLPALKYEGSNGKTHIVSAWMPSPEEMADLNAGKPLYLNIIGGQPPVALYTGDDPY